MVDISMAGGAPRDGTNGTNGVDGVRGSIWTTASGAPITTANAGDMYLDTATGNVYTMAAGVWTLTGNIRGPNGTNGTNGTNGAPGALVYNAGGLVANAKIWSGTVTTNASGVWTVNYAAAGFTGTPRVQATCTGPGATASDVRNASTTAKSATAASGICVAPALSVLGLITVSLVGAGVSVDVVAIGE